MNRIRSSAEGQAVLAGSLVAFPLLDVLSLLETTRHVGELKIVSEGSDDHFFVDAGDLIDPTGGATGRLFELACSGDAWFTVTADTGAGTGASTRVGGSRVALRTVLDHLAPRLSEWDALRRSVPLEATARMAPSTSLPEVHVRADQWKVLSRLGSGRRVGDVVDETDGSPVETLRVLRELADAGLVSLGSPAAAALLPPRRTRGSGATAALAGVPAGGAARHGDGAGEGGGGGSRGADRAGRPGRVAARDGRAGDGSGQACDREPGGAQVGDGSGRAGRAGGRRERGARAPVIDVADVTDVTDVTHVARPPVPNSLMPPPVTSRHWASAGSGRRG